MSGRFGRRIAPLVIAASAASIAYFTLRPGGAGPRAAVPGGYLSSDVILNILLFIPFGIGLGLAGVRPRAAALIAGMGSGAIELAQLLLIAGRFAALHDILTNTAGGATGALLVDSWAARQRWWRALSPWAAGTVVVLWTGGAALLRASFPGERWYAQWSHDFEYSEPFAGRVLGVSMQGLPVPEGLIGETPVLRERVRRADTVHYETTVLAGPPTGGRAQIMAVVIPHRGEIASVWEDATAIMARQRLVLADAGFRTPWLRLENALGTGNGDTVHISVATTRSAIHLSARSGGGVREATLRLTPDLFWSAFLPREYEAGPGRRWWPLVPALLTYLALGLALDGRPLLRCAAAGVTLLAGPLLAGSAFPDLALVVTALAGSEAGAWLSTLLGFRKHGGPPPAEAALTRGNIT